MTSKVLLGQRYHAEHLVAPKWPSPPKKKLFRYYLRLLRNAFSKGSTPNQHFSRISKKGSHLPFFKFAFCHHSEVLSRKCGHVSYKHRREVSFLCRMILIDTFHDKIPVSKRQQRILCCILSCAVAILGLQTVYITFKKKSWETVRECFHLREVERNNVPPRNCRNFPCCRQKRDKIGVGGGDFLFSISLPPSLNKPWPYFTMAWVLSFWLTLLEFRVFSSPLPPFQRSKNFPPFLFCCLFTLWCSGRDWVPKQKPRRIWAELDAAMEWMDWESQSRVPMASQYGYIRASHFLCLSLDSFFFDVCFPKWASRRGRGGDVFEIASP